MGILDSVKGFYFSLEDKYYSFCDWLAERGVPVYSIFVDPIENAGLPSFPFAVLILLLLVGGIAYLATGGFGGGTTTLTLHVSSDAGPLDGVPVSLLVAGEKAPRTATSLNGSAKFTDVPVGKTARIVVSQAGFEPYNKSISIESRGSMEVLLQSPQASPTPSAQASVKLVVQVLGDNGNPLPGASIQFQSSGGGSGTEYSDAQGFATLSTFSTQDTFNVDVSADGFSSRQQTVFASLKNYVITLAANHNQPPAQTCSHPPCTRLEVKGSVTVNVANSNGDGVPALVTLYNVELLSPLTSDATDAHGAIHFDSVAAVGTLVYVNVKPRDAAYADYAGFADARELNATGDVVFNVVLNSKTPAQISTFNLTVTDTNKQSLASADVGVYLSESGRRADAATTDANGAASFELAAGQSYAVTAFETGYLPGRLEGVHAGDAKTLQLTKAIAGNNADLRVHVTTSEGDPASGAVVELLYANDASGAATGVPTQTATADGSASFTQLPLGVPLRAKAVLGSASGLSDSFTLDLSSTTKSVDLTLNPTYGTVMVKALDATTKLGVVGARVTAQQSGVNPAPACVTDANAKCSLRVQANLDASLHVEASGFAALDSARFVVATDENQKREVDLLPASLATDLRVVSFRVLDRAGNAVSDSLERGAAYTTEIAVNFPSGMDYSGAFLRVGDQPSLDQEPAAFTAYQAPPENGALNPSIATGDSFGAGACNAQAPSSGTNFKWINYNYTQPAGGSVHTLTASLRVQPTAKNSERVNVYYRVWGVRGGATPLTRTSARVRRARARITVKPPRFPARSAFGRGAGCATRKPVFTLVSLITSPVRLNPPSRRR